MDERLGLLPDPGNAYCHGEAKNNPDSNANAPERDEGRPQIGSPEATLIFLHLLSPQSDEEHDELLSLLEELLSEEQLEEISQPPDAPAPENSPPPPRQLLLTEGWDTDSPSGTKESQGEAATGELLEEAALEEDGE